MIYDHDCYNLNTKYFDNLIEININYILLYDHDDWNIKIIK